MTFTIGFEDLVANALIETLSDNPEKRFLSYSEIEHYGNSIVLFLKQEKLAKVVLVLSRDRTNQVLRNYSDFFEEKTNENGELGIALKEGKTVFDLIDCFRGYLSYDLLLAFIKSYRSGIK